VTSATEARTDVRLAHRGFAARSGRHTEGLRETLARLALPSPSVVEAGEPEVVTWGLPEWHRDRDALLLATTARRHDRDLSAAEVLALVRDDPDGFGELLPSFAAAVSAPGAVSVATDYLGFRHVFHGHRDGAGIISTSSRACALDLGSGLDLDAVAVQSCVGWQLGQRTLFDGVRKLPPGGIATLENGVVTPSTYRRPAPTERMDLERSVRAAAEVLRTYLTSYLEDHPDAVLQLSGGQDSRVLLSAIPKAQRRGLRVVTLGEAGDPDVDIASDLAARYGMQHEVLSLSVVDDLDPATAYTFCLDAARRLDYSSDPIAHAALGFVELGAEPGPRISGVGGEVSRGFYYLGPPTAGPVSARRARQLVKWRVFANDSVPVEALDPSFAQWSRELATQEVVRVLTESGRPWMAATDQLYLEHRMQRWAGVTETAVCLDREVVNPMLDDRFISIATGLRPLDRRNSLFFSRLQLELDAELGSIPLDSRPAPAAYAHRSPRNSALKTMATMTKARKKVVQRLRRDNRPPLGGAAFAAKVVEHWRDDPATLEPLDRLEVFAKDWLDGLVSGAHTPPTSAVALMVNLIGAVDDLSA
jgi:asparagine synthase (glutamine-hydrolysing)